MASITEIEGRIYILHFPNGKKYVGQALDVQKRWWFHSSAARRSNRLLYKAIRKHGWKNIRKEVLPGVYTTKAALNAAEKLYIKELRTHVRWHRGYNLTDGGESNTGWRKYGVDVCVVDGCDAPHNEKGYCHKHAARLRRYGDPQGFKPKPPPKKCVVDGCDAPQRSRKYCPLHYNRWLTHGDPMVVKKGGPAPSAPVVCKVDGCDKISICLSLCGNHYHKEWRQKRAAKSRKKAII